MTAPTSSARGSDPRERRLARSWSLFVGSFLVLALLVVGRGTFAATTPDPALVALAIATGAAIRHWRAARGLEVERREEVESLARMLQGLSRSVSPDAIVDAIVEELGRATGADHVVVVRRAADAGPLEARLVSSRPGVPITTTLFPPTDLDDPVEPAPDGPAIAPPLPGGLLQPAFAAATATLTGARDAGRPVPVGHHGSLDPARMAARSAAAVRTEARRRLSGVGRSDRRPAPEEQRPDTASVAVATGPAGRVAARLAARARRVYGLRNTLAAPLRTEEGVVGALVVSRRLAEPWPPSARRILAAAAAEASAALARAAEHRDAVARATTDALTGLPNRRYFDEFCGLIARRRRADDAVGVLLVDVDRFKLVNDTFGHAAGDAVLRAVASAVAGAVRDDDVPARYGGEEFAVLVRTPSRAVAIDVAERVRAAVGRLDVAHAGPPRVTVSVGVAVASAPDEPIADVIAAADGALYEAKRSGRDRVVAA